MWPDLGKPAILAQKVIICFIDTYCTFVTTDDSSSKRGFSRVIAKCDHALFTLYNVDGLIQKVKNLVYTESIRELTDKYHQFLKSP